MQSLLVCECQNLDYTVASFVNTKGFDSKAYGMLYNAIEKKVTDDDPDTILHTCILELSEQQKVGGFFYTEQLAGSNGMHFTLIKLPEQSEVEMRVGAYNELKRQRDVVSVSFISIDEMLDGAELLKTAGIK